MEVPVPMRGPKGSARDLCCRALWPVVLLAVLLGVAPAGAQETSPPEVTPAPTPTPIPAALISERVVATRVLLEQGRMRIGTGPELDRIEAGLEADEASLPTLTRQTRHELEAAGPPSALDETKRTWSRIDLRLAEWAKTLKERGTLIDSVTSQLEGERALWQLTLEAAEASQLPVAVRREMADTLAAIDVVARELRGERDHLLTLQVRVAGARLVVNEMLELLRVEAARRKRSIFDLDSAPLWRAFTNLGAEGGFSEQLAAILRANAGEIRAYLAGARPNLLRHGIFLVATMAILVFLRRRAQPWVQQDPSLEGTLCVLERPLAAALVIAMLARDSFHPDAPVLWRDLLGVVLVLALLRVLPVLLSAALRPLAYYLAVLLALDQAADLSPDGGLIDRVLLLVVSVVAIWTCLWVRRRLSRDRPAIPEGWFRAVLFGTRALLALFVVAALANLIGAVGVAIFALNFSLFMVFSGLLLWIAAVLLRAVIRVVLLTNTARRFGLVQLHAERVRVALFRLVDVTAVLAWLALALSELSLLKPGVDTARKVLNARLSLGEISITPGDLLLFAVVVWVSFKLSQLMRFALDTDIYPRLDLPRGVPGAISRLSHYTVMVVGVMVAASAAGLDFSRLTFVIGALGVGIGFGLQNVVNNFVSGLILLFERPIRIGDRVELGQLTGEVANIGIRASIIHTWQGAEVIVPNADLISSQVTNWTLSDEVRRVEITVGVAYGTDPETVLELLLGVARAHPGVLEDPEPVAVFVGFGASSLDFELRAWTTDDIVRIPSDLRVGINRSLAEAGIEIPFPQRDLHLRSVSGDAAGRLHGPEKA
jgi:small-conductance mechanosensitive channel